MHDQAAGLRPRRARRGRGAARSSGTSQLCPGCEDELEPLRASRRSRSRSRASSRLRAPRSAGGCSRSTQRRSSVRRRPLDGAARLPRSPPSPPAQPLRSVVGLHRTARGHARHRSGEAVLAVRRCLPHPPGRRTRSGSSPRARVARPASSAARSNARRHTCRTGPRSPSRSSRPAARAGRRDRSC